MPRKKPRESHCGDLGGGSVTFVACTSGKCGNAGSRIKVLGLLALAWCLESLAVECGQRKGRKIERDTDEGNEIMREVSTRLHLRRRSIHYSTSRSGKLSTSVRRKKTRHSEFEIGIRFDSSGKAVEAAVGSNAASLLASRQSSFDVVRRRSGKFIDLAGRMNFVCTHFCAPPVW